LHIYFDTVLTSHPYSLKLNPKLSSLCCTTAVVCCGSKCRWADSLFFWKGQEEEWGMEILGASGVKGMHW
jgi:hypothetical protein